MATRARSSTAATRTAAKKAPAKKAAATKTASTTASKQGAAKKTAATRTASGTAAAKQAAATKAPAKKTAAKRPAAGGDARYTKPELRARLKDRIQAGTKGGKAGQWSARKAQLLAHEYEQAGGGYAGDRSASQRHLAEWTSEEWTTADGKKAQRKGGTARYLPREAWNKLSAGEKAATDEKKRAGSRGGRQVVAKTAKARGARAAASSGAGR